MTKDDCTKENITKMLRHFPFVLLPTNIFCHTYISLYRFLYIF